MTLREEKMRDGFVKFHLPELGTVMHHLTIPDVNNIHDHPFQFTTHILKGSYVERVYHYDAGWFRVEDILRKQGTTHVVEATAIHEIIELPDGECWTVITPEKWEREPRFWEFREDGVYSRQWNEKDWTKHD